MTRRKKRGPIGLVTRTTRPAVEGVEFRKVPLPLGPGQIERFTFKPIPETADQIKAYIAKLRIFLADATASEQPGPRRTVRVHCLRDGGVIQVSVPEKSDPQILDDAIAARHALRSLAKLEHYLSQLERQPDLASVRSLAYEAVLTALHFGSDFHQWTVVDNEIAIDAQRRSVEGAQNAQSTLKAKARAKRLEQRNVRMAKEFQERKRRSGKSDFALKVAIGKVNKLGTRQSVYAIDAGLKKILCSNRGKLQK
jgi:hypothetical protein